MVDRYSASACAMPFTMNPKIADQTVAIDSLVYFHLRISIDKQNMVKNKETKRSPRGCWLYQHKNTTVNE